MQTPVDDSDILLEVSRSSSLPRKGQAPGWVTPWIAPCLPHVQVGFRDGPTWIAPCHLHYRATSQNVVGLTNVFGVVLQDYMPLRVQQWCAQAPSGKRYTNPTKH